VGDRTLRRTTNPNILLYVPLLSRSALSSTLRDSEMKSRVPNRSDQKMITGNQLLAACPADAIIQSRATLAMRKSS
jgi:hypothetical protein